MRDGLEAIRQAVFMALSSSRYEHLIYSEEYGSEINKLIGSNPIFIETELRRMIEETLMPDERISGLRILLWIIMVTGYLLGSLLYHLTAISMLNRW
ncbi:DUF2634 domain-containing protein [Paenibacillus thiaminolyticus]|uniref:DUF2634 domain-containing protein n=1 Tax=Paenibacillus thiaminolyticus TaxID=49283 RepID=UPI003B97EBDF